MSHTIIRIEHEDGWGMMRWPEGKRRYTVGDSEETVRMHERHCEMPTPRQDGIVKYYDDYQDYFCAFKSMEDFNFICKKDEIKFLLTKNFKVLLIEVSKMLSGSFQVMYRKEDIISSKNISSLFV